MSLFFLQIACQTVFTSHYKNKFTGLLSGAPFDSQLELDRILHQCFQLKGFARNNTELVYSQLEQFLKRQLKICEQSDVTNDGEMTSS